MSRRRPAILRMPLVSLVAVLAVACGGADGDVEASDEQPTDGADTQAADASDEDDPDAADGTDADAPTDTDDPEDADSGPSAHRPAADAVSDAGCEELADGSPGAVIAFPTDGDQAGVTPVTVEVVGCSDTFESNLQYEAFHGADTTATLDGFTSGGTLGDWAPFGFEETYWTPGEWRVVVFELDAESGDRVEYDEVTFVVAPD